MSATLGRCLGSILTQTFGDYQVVIVDDSSADESLAIAKETEHYELHSRVIGFDVSDKAVSLSHAYELTPEFHFLYLLTHIAKHISHSGAGIRMYLYLAFFIQRFGKSLNVRDFFSG